MTSQLQSIGVQARARRADLHESPFTAGTPCHGCPHMTCSARPSRMAAGVRTYTWRHHCSRAAGGKGAVVEPAPGTCHAGEGARDARVRRVPEFGDWLACKLAERGMSHSELAREVGVGRAAVDRWVEGRNRPRTPSRRRVYWSLGAVWPGEADPTCAPPRG